jgi:hypothetical protein
MTNPAERPLFTDAHPRPTAPSKDLRNEKVTLYDRAGNPREITRANAREAIEKGGWTTDPAEGEKRRAAPLEPVRHLNFEHGEHGMTTRHLQTRTSSPVIGGVAQYEITPAAPSEGA